MSSETQQHTYKFALRPHAEILAAACSDLLETQQLNIVIASNLLQDGRQFESAVHFDNCAFLAGAQYVASELRNMRQSRNPRDGNALAAFGRLSHTIQDFYSHSNWIEIHEASNPIPLWDLQYDSLPLGIMSGTWLLGFPKECSQGTPSHDDMNKDEPTSAKGQGIVESVSNAGKSFFELARETAVRATREQARQLFGLAKAALPAAPDSSREVDASIAGLDLLITNLEDMLAEAQKLRHSLSASRPTDKAGSSG
jgi:hypothetical protein